MVKKGFVALVALALASCSQTVGTSPHSLSDSTPVMELSAAERARIQKAGAEILFWSDQQRSANFRNMEAIFPGLTSKHGAVRKLEKGAPLNVDTAALQAFMDEQQVAGLMVLQDGKIRLEKYGLGFTADGRWTSFSVAKSFTSTLVGAAVKDGFIGSINDPVTKYVPELNGSGYDNVTVEQILTMTSGVKWNEAYTDPNSDVVKMLSVPIEAGVDPNVAYLAGLPSEAAPGSKWVYKTGETNLIGVVVARATGRSMADYAEEKIVKPAGFAGDMFWMVDTVGQNIGGCCLSIRLDDYARMGQFVLEGGGDQVPDGWFVKATSEHKNIGIPGFGYGYQWWTYPGGNYGAQGIFGQAITVIPEKNMVIAMVANWPKASARELRMGQLMFFQKLVASAD